GSFVEKFFITIADGKSLQIGLVSAGKRYYHRGVYSSAQKSSERNISDQSSLYRSFEESCEFSLRLFVSDMVTRSIVPLIRDCIILPHFKFAPRHFHAVARQQFLYMNKNGLRRWNIVELKKSIQGSIIQGS